MNKKRKNPLYVVTNNGKDVLEASGLIDAVAKKLGLEPLLQQLESLVQAMLAMVSSYAVFSVIKEWLDELVELLEKIVKRVDPVLAFSVFQKN